MVCVGKAPVSQGQLFMYNTLVEILNFAFFINLIDLTPLCLKRSTDASLWRSVRALGSPRLLWAFRQTIHSC